MRKRFTRDEREAFQPDTRVEWRNVSHWHAGTVIGTPEQDSDGWWSVKVTNHVTTRTVSAGELIISTPGTVRVPQSTTVTA